MIQNQTTLPGRNAFTRLNPRHTGDIMSTRSRTGLLLARTMGAALTALLLTISSITQAKEEPDYGENWGEWRALGGGYVGRRRVPPPRAKTPATQRQLAGAWKEGRRGNARLGDVTGSSGARATALALQNGTEVNALWLRTISEGLHEVSVTDLAAELGEPEKRIRRKAKKGKLSLTNAGNPVSWHFDPATDGILFAAETNNTFFTDENAYRFSLDSRKALPMVVNNGSPSGSSGYETSFVDTLVFEEEPDWYYSVMVVQSEPDADYWYWDYLFGGSKDFIKLDLPVPNPDQDSSDLARLSVTLRGATDLEDGVDHRVYVEINDTELYLHDSQMIDGHYVVSWDGFEAKTLVADLEPGLLVPGNNVVRIHTQDPAGVHPLQWLDTVEIDYPRQPVAVDGELWLHNVEAGVQTATGFASENLMIIESPTGAAVLRKDITVEQNIITGDWSVTFDVENAGNDYLIVEASATQQPMLAPDYKSTLAKRNNLADYLIIAPRDFTATAEALAEHRRGRFGFVRIAWLDDIYDEFNGGREDPNAIASFLRRVQSAWALEPEYVVIIGKGTLDHKNRMDYSDSYVPVLLAGTPWGAASSDDRFLGNYRHSMPAIGRISVGILPVTDDTHAEQEGLDYVQKIVEYEAIGLGGSGAVLVADNPDEAGDFHLNLYAIAEQLDAMGVNPVRKLFHLSAVEDPVGDELRNPATWETRFVNYDGHGSISTMGDNSERFLSTTDAATLTNEIQPVFAALTCSVGNDVQMGRRSLAGALVLNSGGGAIAAVVPSGLSLDHDAHQLNSALVDNLFFGGGQSVGASLRDAKISTLNDISEFMPKIYSVAGDPAVLLR
ncbi:MAG: hypothetical protein GY794_25675 [bacterium]|nr:hypothetical protein [bacterium]